MGKKFLAEEATIKLYYHRTDGGDEIKEAVADWKAKHA